MIVVLFAVTPRGDVNLEDYRQASARMRELVATIPGFISYNSYRADDGETVAIARFESEEALDEWRFHPEHRAIQAKGRQSYYQQYWVQVCSTLREYRFAGKGYERDLRTLFAAGSAISAAR
jgi:heme-degrading monooxygenase HmoA